MSNSSVRIAPYGSWKSPITSARIVEFSIGLSEVRFDGDDVCWVEQRLTENRYAVVRRSASGTSVLPGPYSARTRVHEYLGGAWSVLNGALYFSNDPPGSRCWHTGANHSLGAKPSGGLPTGSSIARAIAGLGFAKSTRATKRRTGRGIRRTRLSQWI